MSTVFIGKISNSNEKIEPLVQDDTAGINWINLEEVEEISLAFDHKKIITDYKKWKRSGGTFWSSKE